MRLLVVVWVDRLGVRTVTLRIDGFAVRGCVSSMVDHSCSSARSRRSIGITAVGNLQFLIFDDLLEQMDDGDG